MAKQILIASVDRTADVKIEGFSIEQVLTWEEDSCSFIVKSGSRPSEGEEIIVLDGATKLFAGIIDEVKDEVITPSVTWYHCKARDYTYRLDAKLVVETYQNQSASNIFLDIAAKYCSGFTTNNVATGAPTVEELIFDYVRPSDAFKELCDYIGWSWYVDYDKDLHFFNPMEVTEPAPITIDASAHVREHRHTLEISGLRNRVYVRGGTMLSDPWTYEVKADGSARSWWLPHKPHNLTLTVGGVAKTVGIENVDDESTKDFLMNFQEKYVRCSAQTATPASGTTLAFTYKYDIDVITMVEDVESQQAIAAVQGGDGVYEHSIVDDSLTTIDAAEAAGNADLREHANPRVKGSFETEVNGWSPGQLVTINLPDRGITGTFLVQKVTITPATDILWTYRVEYGGRLLGIADWLQALWKAQQKKKLNETAILHKFHYGAETAKVTDEVQGTLRVAPWLVELGLEQFIDVLEFPTSAFTRPTPAYNDDGTQVAANVPRYKAGKYNSGVWIEEGTQNLLKNASFEVYTGTNGAADGWMYGVSAAVTASFAVDTTIHRPSGTKSQKAEITASTGAGDANIIQDNPGTPGVTYTHTRYVQGSVAGTTVGFIRLVFFDSAGVMLGSTEVTFIPTSTWQRVSVTATAPTGTATVRAAGGIKAQAAGDTGVIYMDDAQLEAKPYATSIIFANDTTTQPTRPADNLSYTLPKPLPVRNAGCLWYKPTYASGRAVSLAWIMNTAATPVWRYEVGHDGSAFVFKKNDGTTVYSLATAVVSFAAGDVIFLAWLDDPTAGVMKLWYGINGAALTEVSLANTVQITDAQKVYLGCRDVAGYECDGVIDDPQLYSAATIIANGGAVDTAFWNAVYTSTAAQKATEATIMLAHLDGNLIPWVGFGQQYSTVGGLARIQQLDNNPWPKLQYSTSTDGLSWSSYQDVPNTPIEVPAYLRVRGAAALPVKVGVRNWKKPFDQTDAVCGFVAVDGGWFIMPGMVCGVTERKVA